MLGNHLSSRVVDFVTDAVWLFWFGGLTFYMAVVVPIGSEILGSDVQGEVTSQVTSYINLASLVAATLIFLRGWKRSSRWLMVCASLITLCSLLMVVLRRWLLERMLGEVSSGEATGEYGASEFQLWLDTWSFYSLHRVYLWVTTFQWLCGVIILWKMSDKPSDQSSEISL